MATSDRLVTTTSHTSRDSEGDGNRVDFEVRTMIWNRYYHNDINVTDVCSGSLRPRAAGPGLPVHVAIVLAFVTDHPNMAV